MKIWTDAKTIENWKIFENFESISSKCQFISIHKNMDTRCVIGISINLTLSIYLEKLERKSGELQNKVKILADGKILKSWKIFEKLETYIPAFESV